jgi:hypothetical protein
MLSVLCMTVLYPLYTLQARVPYLIILEFLSGALGVAMGPTTSIRVGRVSFGVPWTFHRVVLDLIDFGRYNRSAARSIHRTSLIVQLFALRARSLLIFHSAAHLCHPPKVSAC